jgi:hypothetical protein
MRDDFDPKTKETLAGRVGYRCSNPRCRQLTSGPRTDPTKAVNIGVAAHITAASPGGPRYDPQLSPEERSSIDNAIWLCQNCAKMVDNDEQRYTADLLREWKFLSEQRALLEIEQRDAPRGLEEARGAALVLYMAVVGKPQPALREGMSKLRLDVAITSTNEVGSENGALKLTVAWPLMFSSSTQIVFRPAQFEMATGLSLEGCEDVPHAQSMKIRWAASQGTVVLPGDWHDFYGNPVYLDIPKPSLIPNPTYLVQAELFTANSGPRRKLYFIRHNQGGDFEIDEADRASYYDIVESFWTTYHTAHEKLKN